MRRAVAALALAAAACASSPDRAWESGYTIHASPGFEDQAAEMAELARTWSPRVADRLGTQRDAPLTIWLREEPYRHATGLTTDRFIAIAPTDQRHFTLVHELAHWHMHGTDWERLPQVVEEGLCDLIAAEGLGVTAELATALLPRLAEAFPRHRELLRLSNRAYLALDLEGRRSASAFGWYLAARHGVEGLRALLADSPDRASLLAALEATPLSLDEARAWTTAPSAPATLPLVRGPSPPTWIVTLVWRDADGRPISLHLDRVAGRIGSVPMIADDSAPTLRIPEDSASVTVHVSRPDG